jgi:hypothetical protein
VRDVVARLAAPLGRVHLAAPIAALAPTAGAPHLATITVNGEEHTGFAHVILATQADGAAALLASYASALPASSSSLATPTLTSAPSPSQREIVARQVACLRRFAYRTTVVVTHTDARLLPDDPRDWRDLNLITAEARAGALEAEKRADGEASEFGLGAEPLRADLCVPPTYTMATHIVRAPHPHTLSSEEGGRGYGGVYQTTDPVVAPRAACVLSAARLERAVLTPNAKAALRELSVPADGRDDRDGEDSAESWWRRRWRSGWRCAGSAERRLGVLQGGVRGALGSELALAGLRREGEAREEGPGIWLCGSYAHSGIPLLEGCVVSARAVVEQGILANEGVALGRTPWS